MKSSLTPAVLNVEPRAFGVEPVALSVEIVPSRVSRACLILVAAAAAAAVLHAAIPWPAKLAAIGALSAIALWTGCSQSRSRGRLRWREGWTWTGGDGDERPLRLRSATLWPGLIVLDFAFADARGGLTLTLWRDSLDADAARRLRIHLRHSPVFAE